MAQILCSSLEDKVSLLGLGWTITSIFSLLALITAAVMSALTHSYYKNLAVSSYYDYNNYNQDGNGQESGDAQVYQALASVRSFSVIFAGLYTMILAGSLSFFGGMCCVGFISLKGKYVRPIWTGTDSSNVSPKNLGIFLGTLVLFSNLCLVIAVVLGEFQVGNYLDEKEKEELGNFAIEKTANLLGTMSMFLSVLYALYSIMLFTSMRELLEPKNQNQRLGYIAPRGTIA